MSFDNHFNPIKKADLILSKSEPQFNKIETNAFLDTTYFSSKARSAIFRLGIPRELASILYEYCFLSGSAICDLYHNLTPKDYDLWFTNSEGAVKAFDLILTYYDLDDQVEYVAGEGRLYIRNPDAVLRKTKGTDISYITQKGITFKKGETVVQVLICELNSPEEIVSKFDYAHTQAYTYLTYNSPLFASEIGITYIKERQLKLLNCNNPVSTLLRALKFGDKGYKSFLHDPNLVELITSLANMSDSEIEDKLPISES